MNILLAKIQDETSPGQYPVFWVTDEQYKTEKGRIEVANNIQKLFRTYADQYPDIFESYEKIQVGIEPIVEAVGILKDWALAAKYDDADDWDLMGETYEQFTHINLKRQQGQFFTNRLVINTMVKMLDPVVGEHSLDPAGGSGGFATALFRYLRRKVIDSTMPNSPARDRQIDSIKNSVFLVEIAPRLVKIAKCAMLLTGDGQTGMTCGNSIGKYNDLDPWIQSRCFVNTSNAPDIIATNPPFSGQKVESQISDRVLLKEFSFGHATKRNTDGTFQFGETDKEILQSQAPELLFLERCIDWLKPGGRIGIVLPKGVLDNLSYEPYRQWVLEHCRLDAVVTLHKNTFMPDTGVRTCILFLYKPKQSETVPDDYPIFMAQSQRIGQDTDGNPVYILDGNGNSTGIINQDLDEIADAYYRFKTGEEHKSEYINSIRRSEIKDNLNINPQHYSPKLNAALEHVLSFDGREGWSTTTISQLEPGIKIFMGPRWKSTNIVVENPSNKSGLTPFLTANAAQELRRLTVKWLDTRIATKKQKETIESLRVERGDILISRSGTIGKVTYATSDLADNYVISDDLIRIRVEDPMLRAYLLAYFTSSTAMSLMLRDEYGSVQQHLQPRHIQQLIIPVPDNWEKVQGIIELGQKMIDSMESVSQVDRELRLNGFDSLNPMNDDFGGEKE